MDAEPKRPWWRKKRWRIASAIVLLIPVGYPGSMAPAAYCIGRGWIGESTLESFYGPVVRAMDAAIEAGRPSVAVAQVVKADGRVVTSRSQVRTSWWAPTAAAFARNYWDFIGSCAEAGASHAR